MLFELKGFLIQTAKRLEHIADGIGDIEKALAETPDKDIGEIKKKSSVKKEIPKKAKTIAKKSVKKAASKKKSAEKAAAKPSATNVEMVFNVIKDGGEMTKKAIDSQLKGMSRKSIQNTIFVLTQAGLIENPRRGVYRAVQ